MQGLAIRLFGGAPGLLPGGGALAGRARAVLEGRAAGGVLGGEESGAKGR